ncbi:MULTISPECIES: TlpA family protein disulfide reductase [unclassified Sedimentibacter]|uniref:TlpA family protein disulfide reductase n=1 Tax=unclassified Sedimentibacter TaxID=2649220 RepID=UPI0027E03283|nr:TlpA disulfide reductase family protein [Sedimentibacter sp. MB35-C1]WMJ77079.1 TlpA disulfide reductase family protein [Sedimentibacter sp. MB35-C1]
MKKIIKIAGIVVGSILGVAVIMFAIMLLRGPSDVVVLTDEQVAEQNAEQTKLYSDVDLSGFDTITVTGEKVTSDFFKDYKVTMINLWTTNCSPCIAEMPDIAKLYDDRPEGSNIISICVDTVDDKKAVKFASEVMEDAGANFMTLVPDETLQTALTNQANIFPTTIFVDCNGKIVGTPHFGGRTGEDYRQAILDRIALIDETASIQ